MYKISIVLEDGKKLVADVCPEDSYKEIFIGVEHNDGTYQDLAVVREQYKYDGAKITPLHGNYSVFVWGNENTDDYTNRIDIKGWEDEETCEK